MRNQNTMRVSPLQGSDIWDTVLVTRRLWFKVCELVAANNGPFMWDSMDVRPKTAILAAETLKRLAGEFDADERKTVEELVAMGATGYGYLLKWTNIVR